MRPERLDEQTTPACVVYPEVNRRKKAMNSDQIKGAAKDVKGDVKKGIGEATGNQKLVDEGNLDKAEGKIQKGVGDIKDKI
jgi:uncharacterized protein YjbJ (UPF0337 family)